MIRLALKVIVLYCAVVFLIALGIMMVGVN